MTRLPRVLLLATAFVPWAAWAQQPPRPLTFSAGVEAVRVDVRVTEGGGPVRGLQPSDFEITDNGVPQHVDFASFEQIPLNVVLALDMSDSVTGPRLGHLQAAARALLDGLKPADQAALVTFSHLVSVRQRLSGERERLRKALDRPEGTGDTALVDAAFTGIMLGESDVGRALLIIFSDGLETMSWLTPAAVLETARRAEVVTYGVSVGGGKTDPFLEELTELTGGALYQAESSKDLGAVFLRVLDEFRGRYLLSYSPQGVSRDGWHRLEVRVKGRRHAVKARPGYLAGNMGTD
jgi:Ca-activated chloride channel homolog